VAWDLESTEAFDTVSEHVTAQQVRTVVDVSADLGWHHDRLAQYAELGFDDIYLHHVGHSQERFIDAFEDHVLPALKEVCRVPQAISCLWRENACLMRRTSRPTSTGMGTVGDPMRETRRIAELRVTCLWVMPFHVAPNRNDGYDVTDLFGMDGRRTRPATRRTDPCVRPPRPHDRRPHEPRVGGSSLTFKHDAGEQGPRRCHVL
jgi:hypothetical protein